jgi:hypothetical protein
MRCSLWPGTLLVMSAVAVASPALWTTDVYGNLTTDFSPSEIVHVHGSGFNPYSIVHISVTRPDGRAAIEQSCRG